MIKAAIFNWIALYADTFSGGNLIGLGGTYILVDISRIGLSEASCPQGPLHPACSRMLFAEPLEANL